MAANRKDPLLRPVLLVTFLLVAVATYLKLKG